MAINYEALKEFDVIDLQALLEMISSDIHPCEVSGPFFRWQRILENSFAGKEPAEFRKIADEWDELEFSSENTVPTVQGPNPDAWQKLTDLDLSVLYHLATGDMHLCYRGPRLEYLARVLEEICGGKAEDGDAAVEKWESRELTAEDKEQERKEKIQNLEFVIKNPHLFFSEETRERSIARAREELKKLKLGK